MMLISKFDTENIEMKVANFEERNNISLPEQYKTFLYKYNGGYTPKTEFKVGKISSSIRVFYGIDSPKYGFENEEILEWVEKGLLPIATDHYGNYIMIGLSHKREGIIYFSDHEKGYKIDKIGENFKSFLKSCKSKEVGDRPLRSIKEREESMIAKGRGDMINDGLRKMWQAEIDKYKNIVQEEVIID